MRSLRAGSSGRVLGYVPRRGGQNAKHVHEEQFAVIASTGQAAGNGMYGAGVNARPTLMSLTLDVLPAMAGGPAPDVTALLGSSREAQLRGNAAAKAGGYCEVSGVDGKQAPLQAVPVWRYNEARRVVELVRLAMLCGPLAEVRARLQSGLAAGEEVAALAESADGWTLARINALRREDVALYMQYVRDRARRMDAEGWRAEEVP